MKRGQKTRRAFLKSSAGTAAGLAMMSAMPKSAGAAARGANDRVRVGLIGCGGRGNYLLGETLKAASALNVEVAALCDVWKVNLDKTVARLATEQPSWKPRTFARYPELLAMNDVDAVIIATPDFAHTPILIDATRAKKDAFVENRWRPCSTTPTPR